MEIQSYFLTLSAFAFWSFSILSRSGSIFLTELGLRSFSVPLRVLRRYGVSTLYLPRSNSLIRGRLRSSRSIPGMSSIRSIMGIFSISFIRSIKGMRSISIRAIGGIGGISAIGGIGGISAIGGIGGITAIGGISGI